ncbi:protein LEG1 homolog [Eleutherodactylus coqui]|uniref:protein LEG1 homolog n=1 Tax=Eleutherodactylus coqui TaxID=57060 RepID=UPI0034636D8E
MLFLLCLVLALGSANPEVSSDNEIYPPLWEFVPESLDDFIVSEEKAVIDPWLYLDRLAMYKILLNVTAQFLDMKEPGNKKNVLWGLPLQNGWQCLTGRLDDPTQQPLGGQKCNSDQKSISPKSWWACMNYYLAVIPFLGAIDAGFFPRFNHSIVISPPVEFQSDFCYSIEECRSFSTELMDKWKSFFELIKTFNKEVEMSVPSLSKEEDKALSYMWAAHVHSINVGLPRCSKRLHYHSNPEENFGKDWATAVEFIAATNFPTNFQSTNNFQKFLPHRVLLANDQAPHIDDFSEEENRVLATLHAINKYNKITGGYLLKLWKKAMCSEEGKAAGRNLLQNMITDPKLAPETIARIIIEMVKNSGCKV